MSNLTKNLFENKALRLCTLEAKGLLAELDALYDGIADAPVVKSGNGYVNVGQIARLVGIQRRRAARLVDELAGAGALDKRGHGYRIHKPENNPLTPTEKPPEKIKNKPEKTTENASDAKTAKTTPPHTPPHKDYIYNIPRDIPGGGCRGGETSCAEPSPSVTTPETTPETKSEKNLTSAHKRDITTADRIESWNQMAMTCGLPKVHKATPSRKAQANKISESDWQAMLEIIPKTPFLLGHSERGWKVNFDFAVSPRGARILEGNYSGLDNAATNPNNAHRRTTQDERFLQHARAAGAAVAATSTGDTGGFRYDPANYQYGVAKQDHRVYEGQTTAGQ